MGKLGRPSGLIGYDTDYNVVRRAEGQPEVRRIVRARTVLYAALIALVGGIMLAALATRETVGLSVIHDRNPVFVRLSDGSIRNGFTVRVANKRLDERRFLLALDGPADARLEVVGAPAAERGALVTVGPDQTQELRVLVTVPRQLPPGTSLPLIFTLTDSASGESASATDHFKGP
jgi:polyferredoxin